MPTRARALTERGALAAIAALSAGGMALEIGLTRLLSTLFVSSWVGPLLAAALLGLGLGAAAAAARPSWRSPVAAARAAAIAPVAAVASVLALLAAGGLGSPLWGLAPLVVAYAAIGLAVAALFARHSVDAARLYRVDLAAAAVAAALTPLALGRLGGLTGSLAAAGLLLLAAWALRRPGRRLALTLGSAAVAVVVLAAATGMLRYDPATMGAPKPIRGQLARGAVIEETRWDALARTDLVRAPEGARMLFMDGGAGSIVPDPDPGRWWNDVGAFAFAVAPAARAFLIGSGGGLDVAQARAHGVGEVIAVEVNRASVDLVRDLGAAAGGVYDPPTEVRIGDGRRELARAPGRFDVITLANVVTGAAELRGAALTENRVYTLEAFGAYLERLTPRGRLSLTLYDEATLTRALTTALEALVRGGWAADHAAATRHVFAVMDARAAPPVPLLLVRPTPFARDEAIAAARVAEARGWSLLVVPDLLAPAALGELAAGALTLDGLIAGSPDLDLRPTTDDRPYFFAFEPGLPRDVRLAGALALAVAAALLLAAAWVGRALGGSAGAPASAGAADVARRWLTAAALGAAFLATELHALQVLQRAAGHPAWSLSLTLGALLVGGAIGAGWAGRRAAGATSPPGTAGVSLPAAVAAGGVLLWLLLAPALAATLDPWPPLVAGTVLAAALVAIGVPMGMPFPRLLAAWGTAGGAPMGDVPGAATDAPRDAAAAREAAGHPGVAAAWAASGIAAVTVGAGAVWLGHALGTPAIGAAAVALYLAAALLHPRR
ncbi:MAG: hypothetical protein ACNA8N_01835 [Trueperaceae bacterium]